jgi:hypothetical protein
MVCRRVVVASLLLAIGARLAWAEHEPLEAHTKHPLKTIVLDNQSIQPSSLEMTTGDALVFENHSTEPISVKFTEPADLRDRIRCGLIRKSAREKSQAPWLLFAWTDGTLVATIPPGRFASVCSLKEGSYAYLTTRLTPGVRAAGGGLVPDKGQINVK